MPGQNPTYRGEGAAAPAVVRGLYRLTLGTAAATLTLIAIGGSVTSRGVGLAVPDWPTTYGYNLFLFPVSQWIGGIFYEHVHRLAAALVGMLTLAVAVYAHGRPARVWLRGLVAAGALGLWAVQSVMRLKPETWVLAAAAGALVSVLSLVWPATPPAPVRIRRLALAAVGLVMVQGIIGGLRVTLFKDEIGIVHAALAQIFLLVLVAIVVLSAPPRQPAQGPIISHATRIWIWAATALVFVQLLLGAAMRHQHAGLAVPDFPLAYGRVWPPTDPASLERANRLRIDPRDFNPITRPQIRLHMTHRLWALVVVLAIAGASWRLTREAGRGHFLARFGGIWFGLVLLQGVLGAAVIWSNKSADISTAHVVGGAVVLAMGTTAGLMAAPNRSPVRSIQARGAGRDEPVPLAAGVKG